MRLEFSHASNFYFGYKAVHEIEIFSCYDFLISGRQYGWVLDGILVSVISKFETCVSYALQCSRSLSSVPPAVRSRRAINVLNARILARVLGYVGAASWCPPK